MIQICPVCQGKGLVKGDFYPDNTKHPIPELEQCRTCRGSGIIFDNTVRIEPYIVPQPQPYPVYPVYPYNPPWYYQITCGTATVSAYPDKKT